MAGALLGGMIPAELVTLGVTILNYLMFTGGSLVKLPQVIKILKTQTVKGFSEVSLGVEFLACLSLCCYNLLMGHALRSWGEMAMIALQCAVQIVLFWVLTTDPIAMFPRVLCVLGTLAATMALWCGLLPQALMPILGLMPTVLGSIARVPQIMLNFRQGHTGNQSVFTWGLSLGGNCIRVITTLVDVQDTVALAGHVIAAGLNFTLVAQILVFSARTNEVLQQESNKAGTSKKVE